jgi:hypothetical protein
MDMKLELQTHNSSQPRRSILDQMRSACPSVGGAWHPAPRNFLQNLNIRNDLIR